MSGLESLELRDLAVIASCLISALAFWRAQRRYENDDLKATVEAMLKLDNRLQMLERAAAAAPTTQQFSELSSKIAVLEARVTERLVTLTTRIDHSEDRNEAVSKSVKRIEDFLMERGK